MSAAKGRKAPVTERALVQRINRKLKAEHQQLRATRPGTRAEREMGHYYIHDYRRNVVTVTRCDVEDLAKEWEVLEAWEELVSDDE
jgi:hypothetical protein